jgi:hypothetical protein
MLALKIDPYTQRKEVVLLEVGQEPPQITVQQALATDRLYVFAANNENVPVSHWDLFWPLVHEHSPTAAGARPIDMSARSIFTASTLYAKLWLRDDMPSAGTPEREAIPGFSFVQSRNPGVWWNGVAYVTLYSRPSGAPLNDRGFLEGILVSWSRLEGFSQTSRVRITAGEGARTLAVCASCHQHIEHTKRCSRCQRVYYCNEQCQRAHWRIHKRDCVAFLR